MRDPHVRDLLGGRAVLVHVAHEREREGLARAAHAERDLRQIERAHGLGGARAGASFAEDLIVHALARVLLNDHIPNVQVSWVKLGVEASQAILQSGANDFGGTLMEETISRMAGAEWGISMSPDRFDDAIRDIGRTPVVRTTTYERAPIPVHPTA